VALLAVALLCGVTWVAAHGASKDSPTAFVTDIRGQIVAIDPAQPEPIGKGASFRGWSRGTSRTGSLYVSEAYRSAATKIPLAVEVAASVLDGPQCSGNLVVLWMHEFVRSVTDGDTASGGTFEAARCSR
jgi:hypothetical protein